MASGAGISLRDWTSLWEQAALAAARRSPNEGVYTGPAWESPPSSSITTNRTWKLAVLQRQPGRGAEHWGHLFLILGENASHVAIQPEGGIPADRNRPPIESLPAVGGVPLDIRLRPRSAETVTRLRTFAIDFQRHAVRLISAGNGPD